MAGRDSRLVKRSELAGLAGATTLDGLTDVVITTPSNNQVLKYNGSQWVNAAAPGGASALDDLTDVTITAAATGDILYYNGSAWVDTAIAELIPLGDLSNVTLTAPANGEYLKYNGSAWVNATISAGASALDDLTDVIISAPSSNQFLRYNGTNWVNTTVSLVGALDDLSDVAISGVATGQILRYNGTNFVNVTPAELYSGTTQVVSTDADGIVVTRKVNIAPAAGNLASPANGDLWYNSTTGKFMAREAGSSLQAFARPYDVSVFIESRATDSELVLRHIVGQAVLFPSGASGSYATARVASTGNVTFAVLKNGVSFATINFNVSATGTWTQASDSTFAAGDVLTITAPATSDSTLQDISITLSGRRTA